MFTSWRGQDAPLGRWSVALRWSRLESASVSSDRTHETALGYPCAGFFLDRNRELGSVSILLTLLLEPHAKGGGYAVL